MQALSLPVELTDLIIDKIPELYRQTHNPKEIQLLPHLSTLALVCHAFRNRVSHHRFAQIALHISDSDTPLSTHSLNRLCALHALVCDAFWSAELAIGHHVRALRIYIYSEGTDPHFLHKLERAECNLYAVEIIERILHKNSQPSRCPYELTLIARPSAQCRVVDWRYMDRQLQRTIEIFCTSSDVELLRIFGFDSVPASLVSHVNKLILRGGDIVNDFKDGQSPAIFSKQDWLDIETNPNLLRIIQSSCSPLAPHLQILKLVVSDLVHCCGSALKCILKTAPTIHTFQLTILTSAMRMGPDSFPFLTRILVNCPTHVSTLCIHHRFLDAASPLKRSAGGRVVDLLSSLPEEALPNLHTLEIQAQFDASDRRTQSVAELLRGHGCIELADFLSHAEFAFSLQRVRVCFILGGYRPSRRGIASEEALASWQTFEQVALSYLSTYFAELGELRPLLQVDISILDRKGWMYDNNNVMSDVSDVMNTIARRRRIRTPWREGIQR